MKIFLLALLLAVDMAGQVAAAEAGSTADNAQVRDDAQRFIERLVSREFAAATAQFNPVMQSALPADKLDRAWNALADKFGTFQRCLPASDDKSGGHRIVTVPCVFANGAIDVRIAFDDQARIGGLHFLPGSAAAPAPQGAAYADPNYVDPGRFEEREVAIGPFALPATLTVPKGAGPWPVAILVHGSGAHDRDETVGPNKPFRDLAGGLASLHIAVLRYEKQAKAHPENYLGKSFTVDDETTNDALAAAAWLRTVADIDPKRIVVLGHSLGAMMAPRIGQRDPQLAGMVLLAAPALPLEDTLARQHHFLAQLNGKGDAANAAALAKIDHQRDVIHALEPGHAPEEPLMLNLPLAYWMDLQRYDAVAVAEKLRQPLLVLQGGRDYQVSPTLDFSHWQALCARQSRVNCKSYPTLNHMFMSGEGAPTPQDYQHAGHVDVRVINDIAAWIERLPASR